MKVLKVTPRGYCKGVVNAIRIAEATRQANPQTDIYILGMLVHNRYVIDALLRLGIITLEDDNVDRLELLDRIDQGIVIFTAHGVSPAVYTKAQAKGLTIVDATCVDVRKTHDIIRRYIAAGYDIIYIGVKGHPEAEGVCGLAEAVHLVSVPADVEMLNLNNKILITNQTTMSIRDIQELAKVIKHRFPQAEMIEEICPATRVRQEAILALPPVGLLYVVGDPKSNNTANLARLGRSRAAKVRKIENVTQIEPKDLEKLEIVAVTSGASTPTALTDQVISYLENYANDKKIPSLSDDIL